MTQPDPTPDFPPEQGDLTRKRQRIEKALTDYEPKLRDAAQAIVFSLGLDRRPHQVAELAREAVQLAAERVLEEADQYQLAQPPYPWIRKFVFNAVRTLRSKRRTERKHLSLVSDTAVAQKTQREGTGDITEEDVLERLWASKNKVDGRTEWKEIFRFMRSDDRLVLEMYLDGYTGEALAGELSRHLGKTIRRGTADTRLSRAKSRLPEAYQRYRQLGE